MTLSAAVLLMLLNTGSSFAEEKIQAFQANGRIIFTNLVNNAPALLATPAVEANSVLAREMPPALRSLVDTISVNHGVDPALVRAVMKTESNFDRWARSPKGALGLMQLIPATGRRYGVIDFFDPHQNIEGGVRYLRFLLDKFNGNIDLALAGYNAGENLVQRLGRIPAIPETTNYVRKIRAIYKNTSAPASTPAEIAVALPAAPEQGASANGLIREPASRIYRFVDERGVVHFSNIGPPN
jgi:soluble lytic murein transglycosylase-like protein